MNSNAHVLRRHARSFDRSFPARPRLAAESACDGVAFVLPEDALGPDYGPVRDAVAGMWRGPMQGGGGRLWVAAFVTPTALPGRLAAGLPLRAVSNGVLASFERESHFDATDVRSRDPRRVELLWAGQFHDVTLDTLESCPVADLWPRPRLHFHPAQAEILGPPTGAPAADDGMKRVTRARIDANQGAPDFLAEIGAGIGRAGEDVRLGSILKRFFGKKGAGGEGAGGQNLGGLMQALRGWIQWHTPLGARLRGAFAERLRTVEKLFAKGDIDLALKLALALGGGESKKPPAFPTGLPGMREALDFGLAGGAAAPILADRYYQTLAERYREIAQRLEAAGDYRRAAYVHSQLLNDHNRAVLTLEKGELFAEAARLAIDAKLEPSLAIRMLYKAGELDAALALARRAAAFEQLAEESRRSRDSVFHAFVIKAWTEMLLTTGQPLRAIQVTDQLAADGPAPLLAARRRWLAAALGSEVGEDYGAELAVRALLTWPGPADPEWLAAFPYMDLSIVEQPFAALLGWFQGLVRGEPEQASERLIELLHDLLRLGRPDHPEQAMFWAGPALPLVDRFARALVGVASARLGKSDLEALRNLVSRARLPVLAEDLSKVVKLLRRPSPVQRLYRSPPSHGAQAAVRRACILAGGATVLWRESRSLELRDRYGGMAWKGPVSDVVGVAVGTGLNVIVIQESEDGARLLTRFDAASHTFHPIGRVRLTAFHDLTTEGQWMVQIGGEIGALDLARLCAPNAEIEFTWSFALTERMRVVAFGLTVAPSANSWITADVSPERGGVHELWTLAPNGRLTNYFCLPGDVRSGPPLNTGADWYWAPQAFSARIRTIDDDVPMEIVVWSAELEGRATALARSRRDDPAGDRFQSCDFGRPYVRRSASDEPGQPGRLALVCPFGKNPAFEIEHDGADRLACVARAPVDDGFGRMRPGAKPILLADQAGRVFKIDFGTGNVSIL